jgi:hypothetical protein
LRWKLEVALDCLRQTFEDIDRWLAKLKGELDLEWHKAGFRLEPWQRQLVTGTVKQQTELKKALPKLL